MHTAEMVMSDGKVSGGSQKKAAARKSDKKVKPKPVAGGASEVATGKKQPRLEQALVKCIRGAILPGEGMPTDGWLEEAAHFILDAAAVRKPGESIVSLASFGEDKRVLHVALINDDMPFLVDSVASAMASMGLVIDRLSHPVVAVERDKDGKLVSLKPANGASGGRESMMHIELPRIDARQRRELQKQLEATLADVRSAVSDWPRMVKAMEADANAVSDAEGSDLLRWFAEGMLTIMGHVTRRRDASHVERLGICRRGIKDLLSDASYDLAFEAFDRQLAAGGPARRPPGPRAKRRRRVRLPPQGGDDKARPRSSGLHWRRRKRAPVWRGAVEGRSRAAAAADIPSKVEDGTG